MWTYRGTACDVWGQNLLINLIQAFKKEKTEYDLLLFTKRSARQVTIGNDKNQWPYLNVIKCITFQLIFLTAFQKHPCLTSHVPHWNPWSQYSTAHQCMALCRRSPGSTAFSCQICSGNTDLSLCAVVWTNTARRNNAFLPYKRGLWQIFQFCHWIAVNGKWND